jgi:hypothetical protein
MQVILQKRRKLQCRLQRRSSLPNALQVVLEQDETRVSVPGSGTFPTWEPQCTFFEVTPESRDKT